MTMTFDEYQEKSRKTALYPAIGQRFVYPAFGLAGEVGELINKIKKVFRDDDNTVTEEKRKEVAGELGDVLWYVAQVASEFDLSLKDVAEENLGKIRSRKERDALGGSGDTR